MIEFEPVPETAKSNFISVPTYYRLVQQELMPPPVKLTPNRSVVPVAEVEAVKAARLAGASDAEVKELVRKLVNARKTATQPRQTNPTRETGQVA